MLQIIATGMVVMERLREGTGATKARRTVRSDVATVVYGAPAVGVALPQRLLLTLRGTATGAAATATYREETGATKARKTARSDAATVVCGALREGPTLTHRRRPTHHHHHHHHHHPRRLKKARLGPLISGIVLVERVMPRPCSRGTRQNTGTALSMLLWTQRHSQVDLGMVRKCG